MDTSAADAYKKELDEYDEEIDQFRAGFAMQLKAFRKAETDFRRGFVALVAFSESGRTVCEFNDTWLWLLGD